MTEPTALSIEADGTMLDKPGFLRLTADGTDLAEYEIREVDVQLYDRVGLMRAKGRWTMDGGSGGMRLYTDIDVHSTAGWQVVAAQITPPATVPYPQPARGPHAMTPARRD